MEAKDSLLFLNNSMLNARMITTEKLWRDKKCLTTNPMNQY